MEIKFNTKFKEGSTVYYQGKKYSVVGDVCIGVKRTENDDVDAVSVNSLQDRIQYTIICVEEDNNDSVPIAVWESELESVTEHEYKRIQDCYAKDNCGKFGIVDKLIYHTSFGYEVIWKSVYHYGDTYIGGVVNKSCYYKEYPIDEISEEEFNELKSKWNEEVKKWIV